MKLPSDVLNQHVAVLGKTRSGKSSVMRGLVEGLLDRKLPVCIIDPKGDWWGIKLAADGKRPGYPVVIFGGEHADVPINAHAGSHVAELFATGNRPCLIDLGGWMVGERTRFWIDFASALFRHTKGNRWLVVDEVHNFGPKGKIMDPDAGKALHWTNRLASEGLGKGLAMIFASQRPQKVHNDTLTSAETLIAMRVLHPSDREAIADWIKGCGDAVLGKKVLDSLSQMERGEGWAWSPEIGFGPERVKFPMFKTYDSFRAQSVQDTKSLKGWAEVDLEDVRSKLASVVEEAKANDPKALKVEIAKLRKELSAKPTGTIDPAKLQAEYQRGVAEERKRWSRGLNGTPAELVRVGATIGKAVETLRGLGDMVDVPANAVSVKETPIHRPAPPVHKTYYAKSLGDDSVGKGGLRRILIALAQRPGMTNRQIGLRAGLSSQSGTFATYMGKARGNGWMRDDGDRRFITDEGMAALGSYEPLPTGNDLLNHWIGELGSGGASRMLRVLADAYPNGLTNEQIGEGAGISHQSGTFATYMGKLRGLELVEGRGEVKASGELFA